MLDVSASLDALRQIGRPMETPGTWTVFTMLLLELSRSRHLALPVSVELLEPLELLVSVPPVVPRGLLHSLVSGLPVLLTIGRFDPVSCPPHLSVVVNVLLVRGHG